MKQTYNYPLNIAIQNRASKAVIEMLLASAPSVLGMADGSLKETSLAILLKNNPDDLSTVDKMLMANYKCVAGRDIRQNTVMHVACSHGAPIDVIRHICIMFPESLHMRNYHRMTPLEMTQRLSVAASDEVSTFLRDRMYGNDEC
jgi:hypothetical protein